MTAANSSKTRLRTSKKSPTKTAGAAFREETRHTVPQLTAIERSTIQLAALQSGIEADLLTKRTLLEFPKFTKHQLHDQSIVSSEIFRISIRIKNGRERTSMKFIHPTIIKLQNLRFGKVSDRVARIINENYHYIGYHREQSTYLGLRTGREASSIVSLVTLSPFDLDHIAAFLPDRLNTSEVMIVSRIYSFPGAPQNTISFLLGRTLRWLRERRPGVKMLLTYLNPNLGFSGSSYRASNWFLFGQEDTRYAYLDGNYITFRELRKLLSADMNPADLEYPKNRVQFSVLPLKPLRLYAFLVNKRLQATYTDHITHYFTKLPSIA